MNYAAQNKIQIKYKLCNIIQENYHLRCDNIHIDKFHNYLKFFICREV